MPLYPNLIRPLLFRCDPEWVHDQSIRACALAGRIPPLRHLLSHLCTFSDPSLTTKVAGITFNNPVGLAAGYDKSGKAIATMAALGFGFIEIGSVSAQPSAGNPKPRLWRLPEDEAICVHYGLPNDGAEVVARRLSGDHWPVPLGINIVKTNHGLHAPPDDAESILNDYLRSAALLHAHGDYLSINLSCPNTEMGRDFFADKSMVTELLTRLTELKITRPVFLKISPAGGIPAIEDWLGAADPFPLVSGFIFNLSPVRPAHLRTPNHKWQNIPGAISGAPVRPAMQQRVRELYQRMDRTRHQIIAAGGISTAADAYAYIRAGASLVQLFTALIYQGPTLIRHVNEGLNHLLTRDGFKNISEAIGADA